MIKRAPLLFFVSVFLFRFAPTSLASTAGSSGADFLNIPMGAGPAALGSAYSALASDAYATVYNPAGLGFLSDLQVSAQHLDYLESIHDEFLGVVIPFKNESGVGLSAQYLGSGNIPATDLSGNSQGSYSTYYGAYTVSYGKRLTERLSLGLTGKWINARISNVSSNAFAGDVGALYHVSDRLSFAATADNFGSKLAFLNDTSALPLEGKLGVAYEPVHGFLFTAEGQFPTAAPSSAHVGLQWEPAQMVVLRAGYKTDTTQGLSAMAGLTVGAGLRLWEQELDYAWLPLGDLGNTQYISLVLRFGAPKEKRNLVYSGDVKNSHTAVEQNDSDLEDLNQLLNSTPEKKSPAPRGETSR